MSNLKSWQVCVAHHDSIRVEATTQDEAEEIAVKRLGITHDVGDVNAYCLGAASPIPAPVSEPSADQLSAALRERNELAKWVELAEGKISSLEAALAASESRIRELETDSERLDWLEAAGVRIETPDLRTFRTYISGKVWYRRGGGMWEHAVCNIRDAIDAGRTSLHPASSPPPE